MNLSRLCMLLLCIYAFTSLVAQAGIRGDFCFVWYNVENLFYPENDSLPGDDEFTPEGLRHWTWFRYREKLTALAKVIIASGGGVPPDLVGLCEVESARVLEDLSSHPILAPYRYSYLHREGPDHRGMDVACLFRSGSTDLIQWECITFRAPVSASRDIMHISFRLGSDTLDLFLVHLISKYRGAGATAMLRRMQAEQLVDCMVSVYNKRSRVLLMAAGDFNESYEGYSMEPLKKAVFGEEALASLKSSGGSGTYKYRGRWSSIDQILLANKVQRYRVHVATLQLSFLLTEDLQFGGLKPRRCYEGYLYRGGISDHLPLVVNLYSSFSSVPGGQ
jgi:endonuclease/exonuclease/phosphatase family metal-dependent hydrolase